MKKLAMIVAFATLGIVGANAGTVVIDVTGTDSWDAYGSANNVHKLVNVGGAGATITGIGWDVTLTATSPSWLQELGVAIGDDAGTSGVFLRPGAGDNFAGTESYSSGGIIDLSDNGIADIVLSDGIVDLEFYESFDDAANAIDGQWVRGTLTLEYEGGDVVPEPMSMMALAAGVAGVLARRRRK